jgi:hypothetical protein
MVADRERFGYATILRFVPVICGVVVAMSQPPCRRHSITSPESWYFLCPCLCTGVASRVRPAIKWQTAMMPCAGRCGARIRLPEHTEPPEGRCIELPARIGKNQDRRPAFYIVTGARSSRRQAIRHLVHQPSCPWKRRRYGGGSCWREKCTYRD